MLPRVGAKLLIIAGSAFITAGLFWYSRVDAHTSYGSGILPAMIVTAIAVALVFVTLTVVAVTKVTDTDTDTGLASALLNVGQQIGGSIGLAVLATAVSSATRSAGASQIGKLTGASRQHLAELLASAQTGKPASPAAYADHPALQAVHVVQAHGSSHGFLVAAVFGLVAVIAAIGLINVKKSDVAQASEPALAAA